MDDSCKDLDHLIGRIIIHKNGRIVDLEAGFVKSCLFLAGPIGDIDQSRVQIWLLDGPVPKGVHLLVGLKVGNLLDLAKEKIRALMGIGLFRANIAFGFGFVSNGSSRAA